MLSYSLRLNCVLLVSFVTVSCSTAQQHDASQATTITILHTNDMHANFVPHEATWMRETPKPMVGGFTELEFKVDSIRKVRPNVLLLDAGDVMTGNPITDREYKGAEGGILFEMMNLIKYDAWTIGNHEFDISQENLKALIRIARFPALSANLVNDKGEFPFNNREYIIVNKGGLRIGMFGLILQSLAGMVLPDNVKGIRVLSPVETAQKVIDKMSAETDLIIALTHQGADNDSVLAANVRGLDIIVGGHSHTRLTKPKVVNDVVIVQAGRYCENLGELEVTVENGKITKFNGKLIQLWPGENRPATQLSTLVDSMQREIENEYNEVIAHLAVDWTRLRGDSNIGQFIADAQREAALADVAFMNVSGIRSNVSAGPLTKQTLFQVLPFRNMLTTFQLSGKQLKKVVLHSMKVEESLVFSGIEATLRKLPNGTFELASIRIGGKPVDDERMYSCAMSDFMVGQAKKYLGLEIDKPIYSKHTIFNVIENAARKAKTIANVTEKRIQIIQ